MEEKENKGLTRFEVLTIAISVFALFMSFLSMNYTVEKDIEDSKEIVDIILSDIKFEHAPSYNKYYVKDISAIIPAYYEVIVSNNSKRAISLVRHDVKQIINNNEVYFDRLIKGVTDKDGKLEYPLYLNPGESKKITFEINLGINSEVDKIIQKRYSYNTRIVYEELKKYLYENGYDIYGNKMKVTYFNEENYLAESIGVPIYPKYKISFTTSRNNEFSNEIKLDDLLLK